MKEAEESLSTTETKYSSLDKTRQRLSNELDDLNLTLENVSALRSSTCLVYCNTIDDGVYISHCCIPLFVKAMLINFYFSDYSL